MRADCTPAELALLQGAAYQQHLRAYVADADGAWQNLTSLGGISHLQDVSLDLDVDSKITTCRIELRRDAGATSSLSPLRTDSTLNRDASAAYASLVDAGREVYVQVAITAPGGSPAAGDWRTVFVGTIDAVDFAGPMMSVDCRDQGALLADLFITESFTDNYTSSPVALETAIQAVLDRATSATLGVTAPTLYAPDSPAYLVNHMSGGIEPLIDPVLRLAQLTGWDCRYLWDNLTSQFRLTLYDPVRSKTVPDLTLDPDQYIDVQTCTIDRTNVRNHILISHGGVTDVSRVTPRATYDSSSVDRYGPKTLHFVEATNGPLETTAEADAFIAYALADLKDPEAELTLEMYPFWPVELHDMVRCTANGVHFDTNTDLAVTKIQHRFGGDRPRTRLSLRGAPAAYFRGWIKRAQVPIGGALPVGVDDVPDLAPTALAPSAAIEESASSDSSVTLSCDGDPDALVGGTLEWQTKTWTDGTVEPAWSGTWQTTALPTSVVVARAAKRNKLVAFRTRDADGRESVRAQRLVPSIMAFVNDSGQPVRGTAWDDGGYAPRATDAAGETLHANVKESGTKEVRRLLAKALAGDSDNADGLPDGLTYYRTTAPQRDGGGRAYNAIDSGNVVVAGGLDFSRGYTNKHAGNLPRSAGNATTLGTIVQHVADTGHAASTLQESGGKEVRRLLAKALAGDVDTFDSVPEGTTYKRITATGRSQLFARRPSHGANLLPNPGFEDFGAFWTSGPGVSFNDDATVARSGNRYMQIARSGAENYGSYAADETGAIRYFEVDQGDVIQFGGYAVRASGDATSRITLAASNKDKAGETYQSTAQVVGGSYTECWAEYTVPAGIQYVRVYAEIIGGAAASTARFDDLWLSVLRKAEDLAAGTLRTGINESGGKPVNRLLAKALAGDSDSVDGLPEGLTYFRTTAVQRDGGGRAHTALDSNSRLTSQTRLPMSAAGNRHSMQSANPLTSVYEGAGTGLSTINVAAHTLYYGGSTISYNGGSAAGLTPGTTYYVFADDPTFAGGAVTYQANPSATAILGNVGRYYVGKIVTATSGGSTTGTGSGGAGGITPT